MGTPFTVSLVLLALLLGAGFALDSGEAEPQAPRAARPLPIATLERRVEQIRALRFRSLPRPAEVSPRQAQRDGLEDLDRTYPEAERRADEEVLKLLGLLEPEVDLREISATIFGQGVAGYYDPRTKRLRIVKGAQTANRFLNEITLAHELTHALEDQRFGLDLEDASGSDDASLANLALVEGTATAVMFTYAERHFSPEQTLGGLFSALGQDTGDLPPFIGSQLIFPYVRGQEFVQRLYRAGGWSVVNSAYRFRPPASTEQIMHPEKYLRVEQPERVRVEARRALGGGWRRLAAGTWGEWATGTLLGEPRAAEGWGGDRYELWQRGSGDCRAPCRDRDALVMRWRWDTRRDAREFESALRDWLAEQPGPVAVRSRGREVALALAPEADLAQRLVQ
jgi:hypothetical protein